VGGRVRGPAAFYFPADGDECDPILEIVQGYTCIDFPMTESSS
jgi:hypothetical protein